MPEGFYKQGKPKAPKKPPVRKSKPAPKKNLFSGAGFSLPTHLPKQKRQLIIHHEDLAINRAQKNRKQLTKIVHGKTNAKHSSYGVGDFLHDAGNVASHIPVVGGLVSLPHQIKNQPGIKVLKEYQKHAMPWLLKHAPHPNLANQEFIPGVKMSSFAPTKDLMHMQKKFFEGARTTFLGAPTIPLEVGAHPLEATKALGTAVKNTFTHPLRDPFTTATMFIGGEGAVGGALGRFEAIAGKAGSQAERSLLKKAILTPIPKERPSGLLPSRNWLVNRQLIKRDEKLTAAIDRVAGKDKASPLALYHENLSMRNKIGRLEQRRREAQNRVDRASAQRLGNYQRLEYEQDKLKPGFKDRTSRFDAVWRKFGYKRLRPGELKLLDVASTGHLKDIDKHIKAHENELASRSKMTLKEYHNHQTQLFLLKQAKRYYENPSKQLKLALEDVRRVSKATEAKKKLPDDIKLRRIGSAHNQIESMAAGVKSHPERLAEIKDEIRAINKKLGPEKMYNKRIIVRINALEKKLAKGKTLTEDETKRLEVWKKSLGATKRMQAQIKKLEGEQNDLSQELLAEGAVALDKGAFYVPESPYAPLKPSSTQQAGENAVSRISAVNEQTFHNYTGYARRHGTTRTDIVNAVHEDFNKTQIIVEKQRAHAFFLQHSVKERPEGATANDYIPILKENIMPPELRREITMPYRGRLSPKDRLELEALHDAATKHYLPDVKDIGPGRPLSIDDVRWVNTRDLGNALDKAGADKLGSIGNVVDIFNTLARAGILYGQGPKYIVNLAQNLVTATLRQGIMLPHNIAVLKSLDMHTLDVIYSLMEESRSRSLYTGHAIDPYAKGIVSRTLRRGVNVAMRGAHGTSEFWNRLTDSGLRATAFIHEARVLGYNTPEKIQQLVKQVEEGNAASRNIVEQIRHRADNEMVPFENQTKFEKEIVRRMFMFYPWLRGATIWTGKFAVEHPIQTAVYSPLAQKGWDRYGVEGNPFWKEGQLKVGGLYTNPRAITTPSTVLENVGAIKSLFQGGVGFSQIPATVGLTGISALLRPDQSLYTGKTDSPIASAWKATGGALPGFQVWRNAQKKGWLKAGEQAMVGQLSDVKATPYTGGHTKKKLTPMEQLHEEIFGKSKRGRKKKGTKTEMEKLHDEIFGNK